MPTITPALILTLTLTQTYTPTSSDKLSWERVDCHQHNAQQNLVCLINRVTNWYDSTNRWRMNSSKQRADSRPSRMCLANASYPAVSQNSVPYKPQEQNCTCSCTSSNFSFILFFIVWCSGLYKPHTVTLTQISDSVCQLIQVSVATSLRLGLGLELPLVKVMS